MRLSATLPTGGRLEPGQSTVGRTLTVPIPGNRRVDFLPSVRALVPPQTPPQFVSAPVTTATAGEPYAYQVAATDGVIKRVIDKLRASGKWDSTMVVLTADHGISFLPTMPQRHTDFADMD